MMANGSVAANVHACVDALPGLQRERVIMMRTAIHAGALFSKSIKRANLLFTAGGQWLAIRVEEGRLWLAIFRGKQLTHLNPRTKPSGKYELANFVFTPDAKVDPAVVRRIAAEAAKLNAELGDPVRAN